MEIPWYSMVGLGITAAIVLWEVIDFFGSFTAIRKAKARMIAAEAEAIEIESLARLRDMARRWQKPPIKKGSTMTTKRLSNIKLSLLRATKQYNDLCGDLPTKRDIIWLANLRGNRTPNRTVSGRYKIVDTLINDGYLTNHSTGPVYALRITRKGIEALS